MTIASVVRMFLPIDAAFCSAERVTMVGSMIPALTRSSTSPVSTFRPWPGFAERTDWITTEPSRPALVASWRSGSSSARNDDLRARLLVALEPLEQRRP